MNCSFNKRANKKQIRRKLREYKEKSVFSYFLSASQPGWEFDWLNFTELRL